MGKCANITQSGFQQELFEKIYVSKSIAKHFTEFWKVKRRTLNLLRTNLGRTS